MTPANGYEAYAKNKITMASPAELTLMLYEGSIKFANLAIAGIEEKDILSLNLWPGDRIFLSRIIENERIPFDLYLTYDADGKLIENKEKTIL